MSQPRLLNRLFLIWGLACLFSASAQAWVIGQVSDFSGPTAPGVKENTEGARLFFKALNARGGVHGQTIELRSLDDRFDPKLTKAHGQALADDPSVLALFLVRGTPNSEALLPVLTDKRIALIGPSTGAMSLHQPVHPWLFNVRASYQREAERAIQHLHSVGVRNIAIASIDNSFGSDAIKGALKGLSSLQLTPTFSAKFAPKDPDFTPIVAEAKAKSPQAIVLIGAAKLVAQGVAQLRAGGSAAQIVTLSNNASSGFVKELGAHARGVIVSQVFPNERSLSNALVKEAIDAAKFFGELDLTPAMLEGYAAAKVLTEGLKRAGPKADRTKLRDALEGLRGYDLGGGLTINYSPDDHSGLDFVDLSIIDATGKFMR